MNCAERLICERDHSEFTLPMLIMFIPTIFSRWATRSCVPPAPLGSTSSSTSSSCGPGRHRQLYLLWQNIYGRQKCQAPYPGDSFGVKISRLSPMPSSLRPSRTSQNSYTIRTSGTFPTRTWFPIKNIFFFFWNHISTIYLVAILFRNNEHEFSIELVLKKNSLVRFKFGRKKFYLIKKKLGMYIIRISHCQIES